MEILALRLVLTPATVLLASLVQHRYGHRLGGRLIGLPLTTGPFLVVLLLTEGTAPTAVAAHGVVAGQVAVVAFCLAYGRLAQRLRVPGVVLAAALALALVSALLVAPIGATWLALLVVLAAIGVGLRGWTLPADQAGVARQVPRWDTAVRVVAAGTVVATLTSLSRILGPQLAGLLASAPVILSVIAPSTHRRSGPLAAQALLRGTLLTMVGTTVFAAVLAYTLVPLGGLAAFGLAVLALVGTDRGAQALRRHPGLGLGALRATPAR